MNNDAVLKEISISGNITGNYFSNEIEQVFVNNSAENIEFIYTFPVPANASISNFTAITGNNRFVGKVKEKGEALKEYQKTISEGDSAYMLESHRDNIFQISLGNVANGETITVNISYIQDLTITDNEMRIVIPTLVSPRYIPGNSIGQNVGMGYSNPTDRVPDADFITPVSGITNYKAECKFKFNLDNDIRNIMSPSHEIEKEFAGGKGTVVINSTDLNSDIVLNISMYGVYNEKFIVSEPTDGKYFSYVSFIPKLGNTIQFNKEYIFMIDISGSMGSNNLDSAKKALKICLRNLEPGDSFNLIAFESGFERFAEKSVDLTEDNFIKADAWIDSLDSGGGTEIFPAIKYAVESAKNNVNGKEKVIMLVTDGQIGNEDEIVRYIKNNFDGRVFSVGIDVNVNDSFLNKVSTVGNGFTEFYYPGSTENLGKKVIRQFIRSNASYLKNIRLETNSGCESVGRPPKYIYNNECYNIILKTDTAVDCLNIIGTDGETEVKIHIPVTGNENNAAMFSKMWAKKKISEMELESADINPRHENIFKEKIVEISVNYGVICRHTNYIAVNERDDKQADLPKLIVISVDKPKNLKCGSVSVSQNFASAINLGSVNYRGITNDPQPVQIDSLFCSFGGDEIDSVEDSGNIQKFDAHSYINDLYNGIIKYENLADEARADLSVKEKIITLANESEKIDFVVYFDKLDKVLSIVEQFIDKRDKEFDDCLKKLLKQLEVNCCIGDNLKNIDDIAGRQNFDGSFCHCREFKVKFSLIALKRFLNESDTNIYKRQIIKLFAFMKQANLTEQDRSEFIKCLCLAKKIGITVQ